MVKRLYRCLLLTLLITHSVVLLCAAEPTSGKPNIVYILADDLGYGDVQCLNPQRGKIKTPNLDRLAAQGMTFTDAHSGSSVCTPTRYGILTGRYAWRTRLQSGVLYGFAPPLIAPGRLTVPALLKQHGYATACVGKWHLGMTFAFSDSAPQKNKMDRLEQTVADWSAPIKGGPTACGFDTYFGISASLDMPPFVYIENDRFTQPATCTKKFLRQGPAAADFEAEDVLPTFARKACASIAARASDANAGKPFFLYLPLNAPHTPIVPSKAWQGKSGLGAYADFVMQTDAVVGDVLDTLEKCGVADNTLVIFTSDNGCSPAAETGKLEAQGHFASAQLRGYKADIWDGGHRVPFLVRWPGKVKAGSQSAQVICHTDLLATCADLLGAKLPDQAGEDSLSILPVLLGKDSQPVHEAVVHHSINGNFAIRQGSWKLEFCPGSGGWSKPRDPEAKKQGLPDIQLYDLGTGLAEVKNVQAEHPEIVERLTKLLEHYIDSGRSTPGAPQPNDVSVKLVKNNSAQAHSRK